jgi:hypothetical protein
MTEMPDAEDALSPPPGSTPSEMFPVLTSAQQARVLAHGQRRTVEQDEIVVEPNEHAGKFFVVVSGQLHILQVTNHQQQIVAVCGRRNIELHPNTEVVALEGGDHLERVTWRTNQTGQTESRNIARLFSMTGAVPNSAWLGGCVACDQGGFIKTGLDHD